MTDRMRAILAVLDASQDKYGRVPMTGNQMGYAIGFSNGMSGGRTSARGKRMGTANRVNFAVTRLDSLGLVSFTPRPDGLSGAATCLTKRGEEYVEEHRAELVESLARVKALAARDARSGGW